MRRGTPIPAMRTGPEPCTARNGCRSPRRGPATWVRRAALRGDEERGTLNSRNEAFIFESRRADYNVGIG